MYIRRLQFRKVVGLVHTCRQNLATVAEQIQHYQHLSRVHTSTVQLNLFRNNRTREITVCGIAACAVVMFSNKNNI